LNNPYGNIQNPNMPAIPNLNYMPNLPNQPNPLYTSPMQQQNNNPGFAQGRNADSQTNIRQPLDSLFSHPFSPFLAQRLANIVIENNKRSAPPQTYPIQPSNPTQQPVLPYYPQQFTRPSSGHNRPSSGHNLAIKPFTGSQYPAQIPPQYPQPMYNVDLNRPYGNPPQLMQQPPTKVNPSPQ
jgi:hypothetical protein